jgi:hypothetical protein
MFFVRFDERRLFCQRALNVPLYIFMRLRNSTAPPKHLMFFHQLHAALRTITRCVLHNFRMHRAGILTSVSAAMFRVCVFAASDYSNGGCGERQSHKHWQDQFGFHICNPLVCCLLNLTVIHEKSKAELCHVWLDRPSCNLFARTKASI